MCINVKELEFDDYHSLLQWKSEEENAPQTTGTNERRYFYWNRAGNYVSKSKGIRQTKSQGTCKIGSQCLAYMKVHQNILNGKIQVEYRNYHHNHKVEIGHLRISEECRITIAAQLQEGVSIQKIMDNIRDKTCYTVNQEQLINKMDIYNIKRQYNIECIEKHQND